MARPASTFRPSDLEEDAPPPYAATAPESDSTTVPDPQQYQPSYPSLDTSYLVQQQQQQQQQLQQLHVGLPSTPPPPIHYYPVMSSAPGQTTSTLSTTATPVVPPPLQYPQYPMLSTAGDGTGASAYPIYPATSSQSGVYHVPQAYPMMGSGHPSPYGAAVAAAAAPAGPGAGSTAHAQGGSSYPVPYPSATGMPPSHHSGSHFPQYHAPLAHFAPPPGTGSPAASTSTAASPHFSPSPAHSAIAAPPPHQQQQQQPVLIASAPNVAVMTPAVLPTAPEGNLIDLDDINGQWEQPEPPRAPHVYTSPVLPPMSTFDVLSPIPAAAPGAPHTGVATSPAVPPQVSPLPLPAAPPAVLPDLVTLYKCRKCGATLDSDTAVCRRIHVGGLSGERQVNQATEADLNERRKLASRANGGGAPPSNGSSSTVGSQGSTEGTTVYDSNHGTSDVYLNHRQYNQSRRSEESTPQIVSPPCLTNESSSTGGTLGRATSMVNPSTHQYHSTASTNDNHGTNDVYIRRSFTTQSPVSSLKKLWRDTKKELMSGQQPPYSSRNHELVAPLPLPPMQQPYPQPEQYRPSPLYPHHHHHPEAAQQQQQQQHGHMGYPVFSSSMTAVGSTISGSTNPFDDPPTPAYNPAHVPVYIPELPTRSQQQQQQPLPVPSAPPPSHSW